MVISYFRKSKHPFGEVMKDLEKTSNELGFKVVGVENLKNLNGYIVYLQKENWVERLIGVDYHLLPFLPLVLFVFESEGKTIVGGGRGALLGNFGYDEDLINLAQEVDVDIKNLVNKIAKVGELKPLKVKLYSTTTCPYCKMEKAWLDAHKVTYEQVFVDLDHKAGEEMIRKTGQAGVPVTEIIYEDSDPDYVIGFDKEQLSRLLGVEERHSS